MFSGVLAALPVGGTFAVAYAASVGLPSSPPPAEKRPSSPDTPNCSPRPDNLDAANQPSTDFTKTSSSHHPAAARKRIGPMTMLTSGFVVPNRGFSPPRLHDVARMRGCWRPRPSRAAHPSDRGVPWSGGMRSLLGVVA